MIINELRTDNTIYSISIFKNENGKYQFVNLTKEKICPCEFDSYEEAFSDLLKYITSGKIKAITFDLSNANSYGLPTKNGKLE